MYRVVCSWNSCGDGNMSLFAVIITVIVLWMAAIAWAILSKRKPEPIPDENDCPACDNGNKLNSGQTCGLCARMKPL